MTDVRTYRRPVSVWWWARKRSYFIFVMRELSSIFVAWFVVFLLLLMAAVARGEADYRDFLEWASTPWVVVLNAIALAFFVLHTITWFSLTPKAMTLEVRGRTVPAQMIIVLQYAGLAVASALVIWLVTR
jgi:fumarate reductase subunit C